MDTPTTHSPLEINRTTNHDARYFLAAIVDSCEDSIVTIDFNNIITTWNPGAERLYGYSAAEAIGKPLTMVTLPEDMRQLLINIDQIKHRQRVKRYETVRLRKQGQLIDLEIELSPVLNDAGEVIGVSTFARDISKRKRVEADLAFLAEISKDLVDLTNVSDTMNTIGQKIGNYFNLSHCDFVEIDHHSTGTVAYHWHRANALHITDEDINAFLTKEFVDRSHSGETIVVNDVFTDAVTSGDRLASMGIGAFITIPVVHSGVLHFWLGFYDNKARLWQKERDCVDARAYHADLRSVRASQSRYRA